MLEVSVFKQKRDRYYSLKFSYDDALITKIKACDKREWDKDNRCWRVSVMSLHSLIMSYKGKTNDIIFKFETPELRLEFINDFNTTKDAEIAEAIRIKEETELYFIKKKVSKDYLLQYDDPMLSPALPVGLKPNVRPYRHQLVGANFLNKIGSGLLAMEQGTGKSLTALISVLFNPEIKRILIICPASIKLNWANEVHNFTYEKAFVLKHNKNPYPMEDCKFIITNYEYFNSKTFKEKKDIIPYGLDKVDTLVLDESHRVANGTSNTSRNIKKSFRKNVVRTFLLSGTPIKNRLPELYPQLHMIAPYEFKTKADFLNKYCGQKFDGMMWIQVGRANPDLMYQDLKGLMYRVKKDDVLDLPPVVHTKINVDLTADERKEYDAILKETREINLHELDISSELTAKPIIEILIKLRQFTSMVKAKYTIQMVQELNNEDHKVVVFDCYKAPLKFINEKIKKGKLYIGETPISERQDIVDRFQSDSMEVSNFVSSMGAGNVGITLTKANYMILNSQSYVPAENSQAWARIDRIGQKRSCNIYTLVCTNTIDETVYQINNAKSSTISGAIDGVKFVNTSNKSALLDIIAQMMKK